MSVLLAAATASLALDVVSKRLVTTHLIEGRLYGRAPGWGFRRVRSHGGGLGRVSVRRAVALWIVAVGCIGLLMSSTALGIVAASGLGMAVGGATGNVADRLARGTVVDFIAAGRWPVFNLADAAMTIGLLLAAVSLL
jgi:signal peptidase II